MVCWTPGHFRLHALKAEPAQIQLLDEYINDPYRVILSDVVVEMLGEQGALRTIFAFDKSLHRALRCLDMHSVRFYRYTVFSHSLDPLLPVGIPKTRRSNCKKRTSAEPQS